MCWARRLRNCTLSTQIFCSLALCSEREWPLRSLARSVMSPLIILPYRHPATDQMIKDSHEREEHMGASQLLAAMNKDYWIIKERSAVKRLIQSCLSSRFWKAVPGQQQIGNLPADRVNESKPFTSTRTDLMGPIQIKFGRNLLKRYVIIFTCLASRAVHFEIVQSLETSAFLQAFRRFCNRRNVKPT